MNGVHRSIEYRFQRLPLEEMRVRARAFLDLMLSRRSVRHFSPEPVPRDLIVAAIRAAAAAPAGANRQPSFEQIARDDEGVATAGRC